MEIKHIMEMYTFPIMEIVPRSHQWVLCLGIDEFLLIFPIVGFSYFFLLMTPMENAKSKSYFGAAFGREGRSPFSCTAVILVIVYIQEWREGCSS